MKIVNHHQDFVCRTSLNIRMMLALVKMIQQHSIVKRTGIQHQVTNGGKMVRKSRILVIEWFFPPDLYSSLTSCKEWV